ncbi:MAG: FtsK/SpoIIIE domain-containing protein [Egibacteraceae bacterium]
MQLVVETAGGVRDVDVNVQVPDATVADLVEALGHSAADGTRGVAVDGRFLQGYLTLTEAGLHDGAVVRLAAGPQPVSAVAHDGPILAVVSGIDAGHRIRLHTGRTVIGRDAACDVTLDSSTVSSQHCAVEVDQLGRAVVKDLDSRNGTWIGDERVAQPRTLPPGELLRLGAVHLTLFERERDDRPAGLDLARHLGSGGNVPFNRPPRAAPPPEPPAMKLPKPPREEPAKQPFSWISLLVPIAVGAVMAAVLSPIYALFMLLSPVMMIGNWVESRRRGKQVSRQEAARFAGDLAAFRNELERLRAKATVRTRAQLPDPSEVLRRASAPSVRLWERRPSDRDFLHLYTGLGTVSWQPPVESDHTERPTEVLELLAEVSHLANVPVPVDLAGGGVVGIAGDRACSVALARSLVCQAAVHHGPADLRIAVLTDPDEASAWEWTKWLPHTRDFDAGGGARLLADRPDDADALLRSLLEAGQARMTSQTGQERETGPVLLTVIDAIGLTEGRNAPARTLLRGDAGPVAGIVLASTTDRLPAVCTTVVELLDPFGTANLAAPQRGEGVEGLVAAGVSVETARACALTLARFEDPEIATAGASLPARVDLTALFADDVFDPEVLTRRWQVGGDDPGAVAPIGVTEDGVLTLDMVRDGPHGLVGGTTGSGKSELLRSLVAGLALGADPQHLNFVLVDYKGGSAFDECARLPHTVGLVTDLDAQLGERALRCLEAELHYRERLLREAGATDLPAYLRLPAAAETPLPRLVVIIDEFATMAAELPDFMEALVGIAQRGRSLGVHLLLATQRPSGAVKDNIRANTNLRIALRVQDVGDSTDVIGVRDAARIGRGQPGRAYVRLGPSEVVPIQTALVTGVSRKDGGRVDVAPFQFGRRSRPAQPKRVSAEEEASDLERLVVAARAAFAASGMPEPRRPWPEPLPTDLPLDAVADPEAVATGSARIALADDPDAQAQYPLGWDLGRGNLLLYGVSGSGTTTTLASLALSLAAGSAPDDLHLYVLDFGAGELAPLDGLPHTGAVITATEGERQRRLVRWLRGELDRRRELGAAQRDEPQLVLLLDGYAAFRAEYDDPAVEWVQDHLARIIAEGPPLGILTVVTADRAGAVPTALSSTVSQKWLLHLADPYDYSAFGVKSQSIGVLPPGRAVVAATSQLIQIGRPAPTLAEAVARVAAGASTGTRRPVALSTLPTAVEPAALRDAVHLADQMWSLPVGIAESALAPAVLRVYPAEHVLVAGPARSGRSGLLHALAHLLVEAAPDVGLTVVATRPSPLRALDVARVVTQADGLPDALAEVAESRGRQVVLIDDADALDDPGGAIERLLKQRLPDVHVIAAGRADTLRSAYGHWTQQVRRSRSGVLLRPDVDLDGDLLGVRLPRRAPVPVTIARGWLVNDGAAEFIQAATIR